jgi:hypothetical protein
VEEDARSGIDCKLMMIVKHMSKMRASLSTRAFFASLPAEPRGAGGGHLCASHSADSHERPEFQCAPLPAPLPRACITENK